MVICEIDVAEDRGQAISHSTSAVRKKIPDATLSVDYGIISDLRQINLGHRKEDFYPVDVVWLSDMVSRIPKLSRQFPTMPALMDMRDIASAFRRILLRPDLTRISATDNPGEALGRGGDVFFGHLAMSPGWVASPAYFKLHTGAISEMRHYYRPHQSVMSGMERINSFMYADDFMLIECLVGKRLGACASCWEWSWGQILRDDSINSEKKIGMTAATSIELTRF